MSILAECPFCKRKQSLRNKRCTCGADLDKVKRSKKIRFWINYRFPGGKQRREPVGFSITEARDAEGKRRVQKREDSHFEYSVVSKLTFQELSEWYLGLKSVKKLASYFRVKISLRNFNKVFGDRKINTIKLMELENFQEDREEQGYAFGTIDLEMVIVKAMINKAFDNDLVDGRVLKVFKKVKRKLKTGANARKRTITFEEYLRLIEIAPKHIKDILTTAYFTGMRSRELRLIQWAHIDREKMFIRLPAEITKESKPKDIPINHHVKKVFDNVPRALKHDFVFTNEGQPIKYRNTLLQWFKNICKKAKLPYGRKALNGITLHDFRRTVKTNMLYAGVNQVYRDLILGHSLKGMDVHYLSVSENSLREAMDKYTKWVDENLKITSVDFSVDEKVIFHI